MPVHYFSKLIYHRVRILSYLYPTSIHVHASQGNMGLCRSSWNGYVQGKIEQCSDSYLMITIWSLKVTEPIEYGLGMCNEEHKRISEENL